MKKEQFIQIPRLFLDSPALQVLNINERHALDRILIEHQRKSGFVNDGLVVTTRDFVNFGVHTRHVIKSLRVLRELGIIECTRNMGGSARGRTPNMWRPTFLPRTPKSNDATHDYLKITTREEAKTIAEAHRIHDTRDRRAPPKPRKLRKFSAPPIATA
jgi:hypothetical protein